MYIIISTDEAEKAFNTIDEAKKYAKKCLYNMENYRLIEISGQYEIKEKTNISFSKL